MTFLQSATSGGGIQQFVFIGAIIGVFYLFIMRPQMKKQKDQRDFATAIQKGDDIVTNSGIVGKVNKIDGQFIVIESNKTFLKVLASSVSKELTDSINGKPEEKKKGFLNI